MNEITWHDMTAAGIDTDNVGETGGCFTLAAGELRIAFGGARDETGRHIRGYDVTSWNHADGCREDENFQTFTRKRDMLKWIASLARKALADD